MNEDNDNHFLKSVTQLGDRQAVINHRDITADSGLKLVAAGTRITSALYNKLVNHKLLPALEQCLSTENTLDHAALLQLADEQLHRNNSPFLAVADELPTEWCAQIIKQIPLPAAIAFKLTVAREERPELFQHSVLLTLLTLYLCRRIGWNEAETVNAAAAALLHDIGILHLNPKLFRAGHTMSLEERRSLYVHPIIGHMILAEFPDYPASVSEAVLQHHERLDGSGYPSGLGREAMGKTGQLLGVAELIGSRFGGNDRCADCGQLDLILKLNANRLNAEYVLHLKPFFSAGDAPREHRGYSLERCRDDILALTTLFADWHSLAAVHHAIDRDEEEQIVVIAREIEQLKKNLLQTGLVFDEHPQGRADADWLQDDAEHLGEVTFLLKEAGWQLSDLFYLLHRRWPDINPSGALRNWIARLPHIYAR
jgi:HD-GYP domain-containing protein (c-di-GMP phosphodiesterase class II)